MGTCPGQDSRFWKPEDIFELACGQCGAPVEFFKDDGTRRCPHCGSRIVNPKISLGCATWCTQAKACLGYDPAQQQEAPEERSLVDQLLAAMRREFGDDQPRIAHAEQVLDYAREILRTEPADPRVVCAAAILHDIGIREAERRHGSAAARYQELEGPPIARRILTACAVDADTLEHVVRIVGSHHTAHDIDTPEFRVLWDADWLVNLPELYPDSTTDHLREIITTVFNTDTGRQLAARLFLEEVSTA